MNRTGQPYFMGIYKKSKQTIVLQLAETVDGLSCELWQYYGQRINSIGNLQRNKSRLLQEINKKHSTDFKHLLIET